MGGGIEMDRSPENEFWLGVAGGVAEAEVLTSEDRRSLMLLCLPITGFTLGRVLVLETLLI